jgi:hypothetical protein
MTDLIPKADKNSNVIIYSLAGLLLIVSGLLFREKIKSKSIEPATDATIVQNSNDAWHQQIIQLQSTNSALMMQLKEIEQQYKMYKDDDTAYFENALATLVNPIKTALNKQQKQETLSLAMQIVMQYIAITHTKTQRRQGSDDYNIKTMKGEKLSAQEAKHTIITANTASDTIPNEMKIVMQLLQDNDVKLPIGLSYMGSQFQ